jgi:hypothetical protein
MHFQDRVKKARSGYKFGMGMTHCDGDIGMAQFAQGEFILEMRDARTGRLLHQFKRKNIITLDAGIQAARYFKDKAEPAHSANMLAVGSGATGALLNPDAPDPKQRKLNSEIARKPFTETTFRDPSGNAVAYPTNIVDFTCVFGEAEAVGPLNEMGILSTISDNTAILNPNPNSFPNRDTTVDLTLYDVLINYLSFSVVTKPSTAVLTITWRLTF